MCMHSALFVFWVARRKQSVLGRVLGMMAENGTLTCLSPSRLLHADYENQFDAYRCECGLACPPLRPRSMRLPPALIISSSTRCFGLAARQVRRAGFELVEHVQATFVDVKEVVSACCNNGKCGHGRRSKPAARARIDGVARAHRSAWQRVVNADFPRAIFEDDAELVGDADDVRYAIHRCQWELSSCGLAYLGIGRDGLLAHAYVVWPRAAARLLTLTRDMCNAHGQDYEMRSICRRQPAPFRSRGAAAAFNCTRPPRGLLRSDRAGKQSTIGWGVFIQNLKAVPSYINLINNARGTHNNANWSSASAVNFHRCAGHGAAAGAEGEADP